MATKKKAVKKSPAKATKKAAKKTGTPSNGAAELKAFKGAIQNLKATGAELAKALLGNPKMSSSVGVRSALDSMQNAAAALVKRLPVGPVPTTVSK
jgi:hypothetical protein